MRLSTLIAFALLMTSTFASADTYEDRARAAFAVKAQAQLRKNDIRIATSANDRLRRIRAFVAAHGGAINAECSVVQLNCHLLEEDHVYCSSFGSGDVVKTPLAGLKPGLRQTVSSCSLDLNDGLACQTDYEGKTASCYDPANRARSFKL